MKKKYSSKHIGFEIQDDVFDGTDPRLVRVHLESLLEDLTEIKKMIGTFAFIDFINDINCTMDIKDTDQSPIYVEKGKIAYSKFKKSDFEKAKEKGLIK